jgi:hypothetical protein
VSAAEARTCALGFLIIVHFHMHGREFADQGCLFGTGESLSEGLKDKRAVKRGS